MSLPRLELYDQNFIPFIIRVAILLYIDFCNILISIYFCLKHSIFSN